MTTYSSSNQPIVPVIPGNETFNLGDVYVLSGAIPPHTEVLRSIPVDPTDTSTWLSFTGVMDAISEGPENDAKGRADVPGAPLWAIVCVFVGLVLIGIGLTWRMAGPFVWSLIHG